jgi:tripartite-type tricarboxylate transporter receptor subunit TctC
MSRRACIASVLAAAAMPVATPVCAEYPERPIRLIVPFAPGGSNDILARLLAQRLSESLRQPVVADNRAGAGGVIGVEVVARAAPDGHTLVMGHIGTHGINPGLYPKLPYDAVRDFAAVAPVAAAPNILLVHPSVPANSVRELIELARARAGQLNYASGGIGGSTHLSAELFRMMAKIDLTHVPYKGGGPALTAILGAEVSVLFNNIVSAMPHVKAGRLRALGISSPQRSPIAPDLVTIAEAGVPGYAIVSWYGVLAPAATPVAIVQRLNREIGMVMNAPAMASRLAADGASAMTATPAEFAQFVRDEVAKWGRVIREAGIRAQ